MKENTRTSNTVNIIETGIIYRVISIATGFITQYVFIHFLGLEYVSLDGLFTNVLSFLSLAELGIGSAISAYLYKPLSNKNEKQISKLMAIYKRCYFVIGNTIFIL